MRHLLFVIFLFIPLLSYGQTEFALYASNDHAAFFDTGKGVIVTQPDTGLHPAACYQLELQKTTEQEGGLAYHTSQQTDYVHILKKTITEFSYCINSQFPENIQSEPSINSLHDGQLYGTIYPYYGSDPAMGSLSHWVIKIDYPYPFVDCGEVDDCSIIHLHATNAHIMQKLHEAQHNKEKILVYGDFVWHLGLIHLNVRKANKLYIVQQYDTLYSLAQKYKTTIEEILALNPLIEQDRIEVDQQIKIP